LRSAPSTWRRSEQAAARAATWAADDAGKKLIVGIAGSNPKMRAGKLSIEAAKPFATVAEIANSPSLLAD
jgi:hypothetical protein